MQGVVRSTEQGNVGEEKQMIDGMVVSKVIGGKKRNELGWAGRCCKIKARSSLLFLKVRGCTTSLIFIQTGRLRGTQQTLAQANTRGNVQGIRSKQTQFYQETGRHISLINVILITCSRSTLYQVSTTLSALLKGMNNSEFTQSLFRKSFLKFNYSIPFS